MAAFLAFCSARKKRLSWKMDAGLRCEICRVGHEEGTCTLSEQSELPLVCTTRYRVLGKVQTEQRKKRARSQRGTRRHKLPHCDNDLPLVMPPPNCPFWWSGLGCPCYSKYTGTVSFRVRPLLRQVLRQVRVGCHPPVSRPFLGVIGSPRSTEASASSSSNSRKGGVQRAQPW